jgi:nitrous oxide reductase accessory protein NosL
MGLAFWAILLTLWTAPQAPAAAGGAALSVPKPGPMDLRPVCGMIVSRYPNWTATVVWKDGRVHHFDGAKNLFKFLDALATYAPGRRREDVRTIAVTEFYDLKKIEARTAFYVIGSDVVGPMGYELVPLATKAGAEEFLKEHFGTRILRFDEVTPDIIRRVDAKRP